MNSFYGKLSLVVAATSMPLLLSAQSLVVGGEHITVSEAAVEIGGTATEYGVAVGFESSAFQGVAIGRGSFANAGSVALGTLDYENDRNATALADDSVAIGPWSEANGYSSVAIGAFTLTTMRDSVALGTYSRAFSKSSVAIGPGAASHADGAVALGNIVRTRALGGVTLGAYSDLTLRRDGTIIDPLTRDSNDPIFIVGNGYYNPNSNPTAVYSNAFIIYRDGLARFEGPVQIKAGSGYLTLQPGGTTNRTLTLPDMDGTMLTSNSTLDPAKLGGGTVDENLLPASVTKLGDTIALDSAETTGDLPWSRVSDKPTTLVAAGYTDAITVQRETIGGVEVIATAIRIKPQGDIPMLGHTP